MSAQLKALYELQLIDLDLAKAQKTRASLGDGSAKKQQVGTVNQEVERVNKLLHEASTEMQDKDLSLKSVETKQKTFKDKLYGGSVTIPKELESMEKEIEMLGRQKGKLEEGILELMDIVEERKSTLADAQTALKQQEEELAAILEKRAQDEASLTTKIKELSVEREKALPAVDAVLLKRYEAMRAHLGGIVVSKVEGDRCSVCHTNIMSGVMRELKTEKDILNCENCGRILYLEG